MVKISLLGLFLALPAGFAFAEFSKRGGRFASFRPFVSRGGAAHKAPLLSKNEEETKTLRVAEPLSQKAVLTEKEESLVEDIQLLSDILAETVNRIDPKVNDLYSQFRELGLARAADVNDDAALQKMVEEAKKLSASEALGVMRMFALALNLVNSAEVQDRLRNIRNFARETEFSEAPSGPLPIIEDSMRGTMDILLSSKGATKEQIYQQLLTQKVEIVLTAHPTEVARRSMLRKYRKVTERLALLKRPDLHQYERDQAIGDLKRIVSSVWGADEIRRVKPTPQVEASGGIAIVESVLWDAVPAYLRKLDAQCRVTLGMRLPVDAVPIKFASWIGGDRDGNPNVTPEVTNEVVLHQRLRAARLLLRDLFILQSELGISSAFSEEMEEYASKIDDPIHQREKYRRVIFHLIKRLVKTARECEADLAALASSETFAPAIDQTVEGWEDVEPIYEAEELIEPLRLCHDSLVKTGFELIAEGRILDIIRRVYAFGLTLVPLDIREESTKHTEALDAITRWLGVGSYAEWSEEARLNFLQAELSNKRPFFRIRDLDSLGFDPSVIKTIRTFFTASTLKPSALGAYVISQAQTASDVLAVMLLQKQVGMTQDRGNMMRVVPLFETLDDLTNAAGVLDTLFSIPTYVGAIRGKQEVMVGYSDSAKDAGRLAASWALYNNQEEMASMAKKHGIELTFFHGKGGTVGRGGNPALYRGILSHPPNTINGRFRVTEQGEMITQNFGNPDIAQHTLDIYTAAVCREAFTKHVEPSKKWREQMDRVSVSSCADYRKLVRGEPRFVPYFRQATPELELGTLNIGSRPSKRNPKGGIESLRAIPWTFAWTQTRAHLSAWLGVGAGLNVSDPAEAETLQEMYEEWPWFRETIDLISMIVSKTDFSISKNYDEQLVDKTGDLLRLGEEVREKLVETRQSVLDVTKSKDVGGAHVALLRASSTIRHPYVDPVNVIQAELLKRYRAMDKRENLTPAEEEEKNNLRDALIMSINGIAQGMRNSG